MPSFTVVADNDNFLVINKSPGVNFHTEDDEPGLFEQVKSSLGLSTLYPVHRLDKMTSGIVLFAKNKPTASAFSHIFEQRNIQKFYLAISDKKPKKKQGLIKGDMEKSRRGTWKFSSTLDNPAITQFFSHSLKPGFRLYLVKPVTGKTHQIRVALKCIKAPILGDPLYADAWQAINIDRGYLHAYSVTFTLFEDTFTFTVPPTEGELFTEQNTLDIIATHYATPATLAWPRR